MPRLASILLLGVAAGCTAMKLVQDKGGESGSIGDIDYFRFVKP